MTDNEKLIEEAAKAIVEVTVDSMDSARELARVALAVFEKAHTPTDDEREALAFVIEQGWANPTWDGVTLRPIDRQIADAVLAAGFTRSEIPERALTLEDLSIASSLKDLVGEARSEGVWCCDNGCGSGACETCPCCSAGWCVSGFDGVPEAPEDRERWLEVAAEHNPVAAALRAAGGGGVR
ncbi:hypothetical protein [Microbacterium sp. NPDC087592]|uniref:hypothetical protein n=1 Tax=Microbacterium sp. NPDC087592 TaxID=3364193 RepID=UPI003801A253